MKILFKTFPEGHLVSDKEFARLKKGFKKLSMDLVREMPADILMVKGFSHTWNQVKLFKYKHKMPIVYYSIGTEWKKGIDLKEANKPIEALYKNADAVVHISDYCRLITEKVFGPRNNVHIIIPAEGPNLPQAYSDTAKGIKCVSTAIWRPVKRLGEMKKMFKGLNKDGIKASLDIYGPNEGPMLTDFREYYNYHIYVQMSRKEGMPNTVLEALSYGLPCLVSNCGGGKEAVGDAGVVIENDPPDDVMFDLDNIEPLDYKKFKAGFVEIIDNLSDYRSKVRRRVNSQLNDLIAAEKFKLVFNSL